MATDKNNPFPIDKDEARFDAPVEAISHAATEVRSEPHSAEPHPAEPLPTQVAAAETVAQVVPAQLEQALNRDGAVLKGVENVLLAAESVSPEAGRHVAQVIGSAVEASQQHLATLVAAPEAAIDGAALKPQEAPVPAAHHAEAAEAAPHHAAEEAPAAEKTGFAAKLTPREGHAAAVAAEVPATRQVG